MIRNESGNAQMKNAVGFFGTTAVIEVDAGATCGIAGTGLNPGVTTRNVMKYNVKEINRTNSYQ